jgi:pimeloyl-ACP methyl ester carboxylesterase
MMVGSRRLWSLVLIAALILVLPSVALAKGYFIGDHGKRPRLIVFVHGLTGSASGTWNTADHAASWPWKIRDPKEEPLFGDADVYVYDYDSNLAGRGPTLSDLTADMSRVLHDEVGVANYETVIFVGHSLGGVLTRQVLLGDEGLRQKTAALYLFAVPQQGSHLATLLGPLASPLVRELQSIRPGHRVTYLDELNSRWINEQAEVPAYCAYETQPTPINRNALVGWIKGFVVLQHSAGTLCNHAFVPLRADHNTIVEQTAGYDLLRTWHLNVVNKSFRLAGGEPNAPVMLASCATRRTSYELAFESAIQAQAAELGQAFRFSRQLPVNWKDTYKDLLWQDHPPKVLVIHLSCFRNGPTANSQADNLERKRDLIALLKTLKSEPRLKILVYSRAFGKYPKYLDGDPVVESYGARLRTFATDFAVPFSSSRTQQDDFRTILKTLLNLPPDVA